MKRTLFLLAVLGCLAADSHGAQTAAPVPNVIIILADDLGYGDVGCYGATKIKTPNMDRLAKEGRIFTDAHACSGVCSPSRYGFLTGEYPCRIGLYKPLMVRDGLVVTPGRLTVA